MMIRNIVGNIPEPDELYGRDEFISNLKGRLAGSRSQNAARAGKDRPEDHFHFR